MNPKHKSLKDVLPESLGLILFIFYGIVSYFLTLSVTPHLSYEYLDPRFVNVLIAFIFMGWYLYAPLSNRTLKSNYVYAVVACAFIVTGIISSVVPLSYRLVAGYGALTVFVLLERLLNPNIKKYLSTRIIHLVLVAFIPLLGPLVGINVEIQVLLQFALLSLIYRRTYSNHMV